MFTFTEDIQSARYKLADYYLREFTEISLYSSSNTYQKVPLQKLYVAMKWQSTGREIKYQSQFTDYTEIFKRVCIYHNSSRKTHKTYIYIYMRLLSIFYFMLFKKLRASGKYQFALL